MDGDTRVAIKIINKDGEGDPTGAQVATEMTLDELLVWLLAAMDGEAEPTWAV